MKLPLEYYQQDDVLFLSRDLLGKFLVTYIDQQLTAGMIIETEAYRAPDDRASHAYGNRRTKRNEVMYHAGGVCYVYRCYGIHALFNVVTNHLNVPHAILIRAIKPVEGIDHMLIRRQKHKNDKNLASGPGTLTQALGIDTVHNGLSLLSSVIWIEDRHIIIPPESIITGPRVGIDYAGEDALLPWRFRTTDKLR
jgi:DNA-3-methyladenine glycosylase